MSSRARLQRFFDDSPDTVQDFLLAAQLSEGEKKERILQEITAAWLPMAHRLATRYRNRGESLDDLRQVAALGLVKAVSGYDPARGTPFEAYAVPTILGELKRHFRDCMWIVHVPRRVQELRTRVRNSRQELLSRSAGEEPTVSAIAAHAGMSEQEVAAATEAQGSFTALSLDAQFEDAHSGYGPSPGSLLGNSDPAFDVVIDRESVKPRLRLLPARERKILYLRFFLDMTQNMIAEDLGISQMHVSRLISRSCARLRDEVLADSLTPRHVTPP